MPSAIEICNIALVAIGASTIRDFTQANKNERVCETMYPHVRDLLLSGYDWSFARKFEYLRATVGAVETEHGVAYDIPVDCLRPMDIYPFGRGQQWEQVGNSIYTKVQNPMLRYTVRELNTGLYTTSFVNALAMQIAVAIAPAIRQNDKFEVRFEQRANTTLLLAQEEDAGRGEQQLHPDRDPNNDSFVNPDTAKLVGFGYGNS